MTKLSKIFEDIGIIENREPLIMGMCSQKAKVVSDLDTDLSNLRKASIEEFEDDLGVTKSIPMSIFALFDEFRVF